MYYTHIYIYIYTYIIHVRRQGGVFSPKHSQIASLERHPLPSHIGHPWHTSGVGKPRNPSSTTWNEDGAARVSSQAGWCWWWFRSRSADWLTFWHFRASGWQTNKRARPVEGGEKTPRQRRATTIALCFLEGVWRCHQNFNIVCDSRWKVSWHFKGN